ncbi:hypothetical protein CTAYLR_002901 [Chrysophaeum taylorii]|uniref:glucose-6-phosphate 1-epimerase n=1 Tax=Chrysophaeum taylorii TaxID=2483200 RepID=A0AAD7XMN3_9STRA|nr:hypothetical protein CTAYLR_002901 [Chrysophaeum taylorii]
MSAMTGELAMCGASVETLFEESVEPVVELVLGGQSARVALFGATVISWRTGARDRLWMSSLSARDGSAPIRGGVPIAFPQFADQGPLTLHGFARTARWRLADRKANLDGTLVEARFVLARSAIADTQGWVGDFELRYTVRLGVRRLELELQVANLGSAPFDFTACLHTYLLLDDVRNVTLHGLSGLEYFDKVAGRDRDEVNDAIRVEAASHSSGDVLGQRAEGFVDRIYRAGGERSPLTLQHAASGETYSIAQSGFPDTIVFNPWVAGKKGTKGPDFDDDGYNHMICVEPAITREGSGPIRVSPGSTWAGTQTIQVL